MSEADVLCHQSGRVGNPMVWSWRASLMGCGSAARLLSLTPFSNICVFARRRRCLLLLFLRHHLPALQRFWQRFQGIACGTGDTCATSTRPSFHQSKSRLWATRSDSRMHVYRFGHISSPSLSRYHLILIFCRSKCLAMSSGLSVCGSGGRWVKD